MFRRWAIAFAGLLGSSYVQGATVSFKPVERGERWPRVELRRDAKDPKGDLEGRVTLKQLTNPERKFSPYLTAKEVGVVTFHGARLVSMVPLDPAIHVPLSSLVAGRYVLEVRVRAASGEVVASAASELDEARVAALVAAPERPKGRPASSRVESLDTEEASRGVDAKLVVLDARELAALPSDDARKSAKVFALAIAARDGELFRQMVPQAGLRTDKGTIPHPELERQLAGGMDSLVGPPPKAPWHVQFDRNAKDRFTMRPTPRASQSVTFERGADGHWRVGQVSKKKADDGE